MTLGLPELLALVGAGGLGVTVNHIITSIQAHRDGARRRERDVITDSEEWRRDADEARRAAEHERDWWRDRAVALWLACSQHGGRPGPLGGPPPHQQ